MADLAVVDLEVIIAQSTVSTDTGSRVGFREKVLERDFCCVFTGIPEVSGESFTYHPIQAGFRGMFSTLVLNDHLITSLSSGLFKVA